MNRSQRLVAISKLARGTSKEYRFTAWPKLGNTKKTKAHTTAHADDTTPQTARARGMYPDRYHKQPQIVDAKPQNSRPT